MGTSYKKQEAYTLYPHSSSYNGMHLGYRPGIILIDVIVIMFTIGKFVFIQISILNLI